MPEHQKNLVFLQAGTLVSDSYGTPLDRHPAGKVVVFGLLKSGNVWLVSL